MICLNFRYPKWIVIFCLLVVSPATFSQATNDYVDTKELTIEWEPVQGSQSYEIEVQGLGEAGFVPLGMFKLNSTQWSSSLNPGKYQFRIRGLDARGVPGLWGEFIPFLVTVPPPILFTPKDKLEIKSEEIEEENIEFTWKPVKGATAYVLEIFPEKVGEAAIFRVEVPEPKTEVKLPVGKKYRWHVYSIDIQKSAGDPVKVQFNFTLFGKRLDGPVLDKLESEFINKISWSRPKGATQFSYMLLRKNSREQWDVLEKKTDWDKTTLDINPKYRGGAYRLRIMSVGYLRPSSETKNFDFPVFDGRRTPQVMEMAKLRRAMELDRDHYIIASYLISSLSYTGDNKETGNRIVYTVLGGTGRLGYGYMPKSRWGWAAIADFGGLNLRNQNYTFASAEVTAIWRRYLGVSSQIRIFGGLFAREIPEAKGFNREDLTVKNIQQAGPLLGLQYWTSFNYKYGLQINAQVNMAAMKLATPNGLAIVPTPTYQLGILGSYKVRENLTGFMGAAYRVDKSSYKAKPYAGGSELNFANEGDVNEVSMVGTYLNLYAEWGF